MKTWIPMWLKENRVQFTSGTNMHFCFNINTHGAINLILPDI